ncbi:hypothetical protein DIU31_005930 [Mucilaginibacter rubeus]|uniref:Uncharacterized protein n=1 Tax=Mucilaginibacter rubeus TaxID=2027860 RepID=A0AAE6MHB1_9SPHI|nr:MULTISPECIES: hypothetical protein [Mucilaginibacter]QEM03079.1 hypothetical protein DIU31_005930 [Mucilaginibacter rubeus]QEM15698.1 hypothetical protein DIU38_006000 [Mucilaginibacter gossypii]QTE41563.1 hypothetical protein J3L19_21780 [Mucilaginibacter rubeus]QTE48169.1 hypothetical protein J3L21_21780 [Mucilaginibacter rubeus]QTE59560.1 hypothetical protein J3L23_13425 [Mucilaginibacter rubeus]
MKLLKKRKTGSAADNQALLRVRLMLTAKQRKVADYLDRKTLYWNRNSKIIALVIFCLLFGGACLLLLIKAIIHY